MPSERVPERTVTGSGSRLQSLAIALTLAALAPAAAAGTPSRLAVREFRGEIGRGVEASFRIQAPLKQVYAVLADPRPGAEFLPYITKVEVERDDGATQVVTYHARHLGLFNTDYTLRRQLHPPDEVAFAQERGLFKRTEGAWHLVATPEGTRAIYRVQVDPGFPVPWPVQSFFIQQGLPAMTDAVRRRCESGGTWRKAGR